jgi:hypothetical protein
VLYWADCALAAYVASDYRLLACRILRIVHCRLKPLQSAASAELACFHVPCVVAKKDGHRFLSPEGMEDVWEQLSLCQSEATSAMSRRPEVTGISHNL